MLYRQRQRALGKLDSASLREVFRKKRSDIPSFARYFDSSMSNAQSYIQFEDIDDFAKLQHVLYDLCLDANAKIQILQSMVDFAHGYNRYPAMEIIGGIFSKLSDEEIKSLYAFFGRNKEVINDMRGHFKASLPRLVQQLLRE